jgi:hypothetical protein
MKKKSAWPNPRPETEDSGQQQKFIIVGQHVTMVLFLYFPGNADGNVVIAVSLLQSGAT